MCLFLLSVLVLLGLYLVAFGLKLGLLIPPGLKPRRDKGQEESYSANLDVISHRFSWTTVGV